MSKITITVDTNKLKCAICKNYLSNPPVFVQYTGDTVCESCNNSDGRPSFRNTTYELLVKGALFPCKYDTKGCTTRVGFNNTRNHEDVCSFKLNECPIDSCDWSGKPKEIVAHFRDGHAATSLESQKFVFHKNGEMFKLVTVKDSNFVVWVNAKHKKISVDVVNLDSRKPVEYKLSLYKPNAREEVEIKKKGTSRVFSGKKEAVEFDKMLITEILGRSEHLECQVFLVVKEDDKK